MSVPSRAAVASIGPALLALGWFAQSVRADAARARAAHDALTQRARIAAAAVREGLEELRAREDERPYAQYSPYYTPPDLITAQASLAPSPLARVPTDPRILGYFQLDPDARVSTPLAHDGASPEALARAAEVTSLARRAVVPSLGGLARRSSASPTPTNVQTQVDFNNAVLADIRAAQQGRNALLPPVSPRNRVSADLRPSSTDSAPSDVAVYTPMRWAASADAAWLYRVVTTDGASSVQGVLLDRDALRTRWLPAVLARHPSDETTLTITRTDARSPCAARVTLPAPLADRALCAEPTHPHTDRTLAWQLAALASVLGLVGWATVARERARVRAESLAARERAFVASVSHELRTPLTTLRMHAEMLQEGWVREDRKARVLAQLVEESSRLSRLIDDVLTFSRLSEPTAALHLHTADLASCVGELIARERARYKARGMSLSTELPASLMARIDRAAIEQIVLNLLENAQKYAPSAAVTVRLSTRGAWAVLRVEDRGPGIAPKDRQRVFERFVRTEAAVSSHVAGTGLGLSIVRGLARAMGGDAVVADAPGCAVEVTLQIEPAPKRL